MLKKNKLILTLFICLPLLLSIGFSSWIIIHTIEVMSEYKNSPTSDLFDSIQSSTYDGNIQLPVVKENVELNGNELITYQYKLSGQSDFKDVTNTIGPKDAGTYDVLVKVTGSTNAKYDGYCQIKLTINKRRVKLSTTEYSVTYDESVPTYEAIKISVNPKLSYIDSENNKITDQLGYIYGMNNGVYCFGDKGYSVSGLTSTQNGDVAGSTYVASIKLFDDEVNNNVFIDNFNNELEYASIIIKYKTARIGSTWFTIEDAITEANKSTNATITLAGDSSSPTSYIETCFTKIPLIDGNPYGKFEFKLNSGNTILVPYKNSLSYRESYVDGSDALVNQLDYNVYSVLTVPANIKLNVSGNLVIGGKLCYDQPNASMTLERGVLINNGTININSEASLKSYGYTKGSGILNLEDGSSATDVIRVYDFPGGNTTSKIMGSTFPMNAWSLNNISCNTYIKHGSSFYGYIYVDTSAGAADGEYLILGTSGKDNNCIFKSSSTNSYIYKYAIYPRTSSTLYTDYSALTDITGCNQLNGIRTEFEINGDYTDEELTISVSSVSFSTSKSVALTYSFADIFVKTGSNLNLQYSDYVFLPGSQILVENGATVTIGSDIDVSIATYQIIVDKSVTISQYNFANYCIDKTDAKFINNGQLVLYGNIGGKIDSEEAGASINLTSSAKNTASFTSLYHAIGGFSGLLASADEMRYKASIGAIGYINSTENASFQTNSEKGKFYISESNSSNKITWVEASNVTLFTIKFYDDTEVIKTLSVGIVTEEGQTASYSFTGSEFKPTKEFYEFACWTNNKGENIEGTTFTDTVIEVYATWIEKNYQFSYIYFIEDENGDLVETQTSDTNLNPDLPDNPYFTINSFVNDYIMISSHPTYANKYFVGWYLPSIVIEETNIKIGLDENYKIDFVLDKENFEYIISYLKENNQADQIIPLACKFTSNKKYNVIVKHNIDGKEVEIEYNELSSKDKVNFPDMNSYYIDWTKDKYLNYWTLIPDNSSYTVDKNTTIEYIVNNLFANMSQSNLTNYQSQYIADDSSPKIIIYAQVAVKKYSITHLNDGNNDKDYLDSGETITHYAVDENQKIPTAAATIKDEFDEDGYITKYDSFKKWKVQNSDVEYDPGKEININSNIIVDATYNESYWCKIEFSGTKTTTVVTHDGQSKSSGDRIPKGSKITISITRNDEKFDEIKINDENQTIPDGSEFKLTDYEVNEHISISSTSSSNSCLVSGTLITLADGTTKLIDDITYDDYILVFNHETGKLDVSQMLFITHESEQFGEHEILELKFSDGSILKIVQEHVLFDMELNEYVILRKENVSEYIGHKFYSTSFKNSSWESNYIELVSYTIYKENVKIYCPVTAFYMNCFANNILTMPSIPGSIMGLFNIFELNDNMKYNEELKNEDIEKYGIFSYEEFNEFIGYEISYEAYLASPAIYLKVSLGKGLITKEEIVFIIEYLLGGSLIT